ncbi:MAG: pectate lyase, partial [Alistipes sp.]|nr:pectate lyase [Alistipes sp.]
DCIAEWQAETGKDVLIALSATKDVQDAILKDAKRAAVVDIIDIRYWHHRADGTTYEPIGGVSMAPRQYARKMKVGSIDFASVYRAVSEYRTAYPTKGVTYFAQNYPAYGWAILMAGGSCPTLRIADEALRRAIPQMTEISSDKDSYRLMGGQGGLVYLPKAAKVEVSLPKGTYALKQIDQRTGEVKTLVKHQKVTTVITLDKISGLYWLERVK